MGSCAETETSSQSGISIATLNFSGILSSPYEFYSKSFDNEKLYETFKQVALSHYPEFGSETFTWKMGSLDAKWTNRFSPLYQLDCGTAQNGTMMSESQFLQAWDKCWESSKEQLKGNYFLQKVGAGKVEQMMERQSGMCRKFDLICYKAFIKDIYGKDLSELGERPCSQYLNAREKHFSQDFLKTKAKINQLMGALQHNSYHIVCLQEVSNDALEELSKAEDYTVVQQSKLTSSVILLQKKYFNTKDLSNQNQEFFEEWSRREGELRKSLLSEETPTQTSDFDEKMLRKRIYLDEDSICQAVDNYVIVSIHLASNPVKNKVQIEEMSRVMKSLLHLFPEKTIIFAGDFNGNVDRQIFQGERTPHVFPDCNKDVTCFKKRSILQVQTRKAGHLSAMSKDYLISSRKLSKCSVKTISGRNILSKKTKEENISELEKESMFLPCNEHMFDHFIVTGILEIEEIVKL